LVVGDGIIIVRCDRRRSGLSSWNVEYGNNLKSNSHISRHNVRHTSGRD